MNQNHFKNQLLIKLIKHQFKININLITTNGNLNKYLQT